MAMTRNAPTVCKAATQEADSREEHQPQAAGAQADRALRALSSKKAAIRSFHFISRIAKRDKADDRQLQRVGRRDGQDVAHHDGLHVDRHRRDRDHEEPQPEERGEDQADDGVFL
jgi:hypothetical protein